jgi:hypothetical protein
MAYIDDTVQGRQHLLVRDYYRRKSDDEKIYSTICFEVGAHALLDGLYPRLRVVSDALVIRELMPAMHWLDAACEDRGTHPEDMPVSRVTREGDRILSLPEALERLDGKWLLTPSGSSPLVVADEGFSREGARMPRRLFATTWVSDERLDTRNVHNRRVRDAVLTARENGLTTGAIDV